jgi:hypothetical protein
VRRSSVCGREITGLELFRKIRKQGKMERVPCQSKPIYIPDAPSGVGSQSTYYRRNMRAREGNGREEGEKGEMLGVGHFRNSNITSHRQPIGL